MGRKMTKNNILKKNNRWLNLHNHLLFLFYSIKRYNTFFLYNLKNCIFNIRRLYVINLCDC